MLDCLVFLNGHLLVESENEPLFQELVEAENQALVSGKKPTLPAFSYTNVYRWKQDQHEEVYVLRFVESLNGGDRVDLINSVSGKRLTQFTEFGGFFLTWDLREDD